MRLRFLTRMAGVALGLTISLPGCAGAQTAAVTRYPANRAVNINPDTHLVLTFASAPVLGKSGQIRIYDAAGHKLVDTLDLSISAGPDPSRRVTAATPPVQAPAETPTSPTTTTPAVRTIPADLHNYQLNTIGGLDDFHFYPVIVHGNVATIYPHSHVLEYGHKYMVQVDAGVLTPAAGSFAGFTTDQAWTFATKKAAPAANAARVVVAADGSGDFNTVQGAVDFVPDTTAQRVTIFIKNGTYEEIVFFRNKANITFRGEDRDKVQIGYANNSGFNPPMPGPSRRCAFSAYDSTGIELTNLSVNNYAYGQAEGLLISGSKNIVSHVNIKGSGDALNLRGPVYLTDSRIVGDGDTILGVGPAFFNHCELSSMGPFMWIRNTDAKQGNVFLDCTFVTRETGCAGCGGSDRDTRCSDASPGADAGCAGAAAQQPRSELSLRRGGADQLQAEGDSRRRLGPGGRRHHAHAPVGVQFDRSGRTSDRCEPAASGVETADDGTGRTDDRELQQPGVCAGRLDTSGGVIALRG